MDATVTTNLGQPTLVIHFNAFTGQLENGYLMRDHKKVSGYLGRDGVLAYLVSRPDVRCEPMKV